MRDVILLLALLAVIPLIFRAPIVGVIAWIWVTLMNPQREVYTFLAGSQLNLFIAVVTLAAWLMSKERKVAPLNPITLFLAVFGVWVSLTTFMAIDPEFSGKLLDRTLKTFILGIAVITLVNTKSRMHAVIWAIVISLGYYAVKGGGFVLLTGGSQRVYGPEDSMISDNNLLGLALVVLLPMINYLRVTSHLRYIRWGCLMAMGFTLVAILGTYSRGALLALAAAVAVYAVRSRSGVVALVIAAGVVFTLPHVMPATWLGRMSTIETADQDASFMGRVAAWKTSVNIATTRPTGGGFSAVELDRVVSAFHTPGSLEGKGKAAHSIYFQVLGDHGFVGLALYLMILASAVLNTVMVLKATRGRPELDWANQLARMLQVSIAAFLVGGAALSMAYYDGVIVLLMLTGALAKIVSQPAVQAASARPGPKWRDVGARDPAALPGPETATDRRALHSD